MIPIHELRCGSYFHRAIFTPADDQGQKKLIPSHVMYRVDMITTLPPTVAYISPKTKKGIQFPIEEIHPVLIKPEILAAAGFFNSIAEPDSWLHKSDASICYWNDGVICFGVEYVKPNCIHLHILQNLWIDVLGHVLPFVPPVPIRQLS